MAVPKETDLKKFVSCNMEMDLIEAEVKALKEGLINKKVFNSLMSLKSKVHVAERCSTLLMHVHETLQERLKQYELMIAANPDTEITVFASQAVDEGIIKKDVIDQIASLHFQVPVAMRARYLLISMQEALLEKFTSLKSHILEIHSIFDNYKGLWQKLDDYVKRGLIFESVLALFPKRKEKLEKLVFWKEEVQRQLMDRKGELNHVVWSSCGKLTLSDMKPSKGEAITTLGPQHLSKLNEILVCYSSKWKNIGAALNFQPQDLETIEAIPSLFTDAPKSYLKRLLQDWLQITLRHTLPPTVENLRKALNSLTVGLGALGSELEASLKSGSHSFARDRPYSSIKVSFDATEPPFYPLHNEIYIGEGDSTLLEVHAAMAGKKDLAYSWLRKGETLSSQPILCLHKADIAWDCIISCEVYASSSEYSSIVDVPITVHVSCPLDEFTASLSSYLCRPEVPKDKWPPTSSTKHINLAIIKQQKVNYGSNYVRCTIRGDMDDILQDKETISYSKLYDSLKSKHQVTFIEGRPGSGKTTFVHKFTQDWARNPSGGIRILLLVSLRVLNNIRNPNLPSILGLFRDLRVTPEIIEKRYGKGVCFIFDGLDEFSPSDGKDSIVYKIIDRSYLHQSTVVVASRPAALAELRNNAGRIVEVIGFLANQIHEYFDHYPFSEVTKPVELKSYLSLHPNILHMCYLPIHATMVAFLFKVTGQVPKTETEMYALFTQLTLVRSISKNHDSKPNSGECLNEEEKFHFRQICQLALDKTLLNKQVLHQEEISYNLQATKEGDISLGLITIDRTADLYGFKDTYTFLHLTFQEYLAAYYISTLSDEEQMKLIEEHGHKNHMLVVWKFFCGLVDIKPYENKFKSILHKTQGNTLYHFQCAYESQQNIVRAQLLKDVNYNIQLANKFLSIPDFVAIGYVTNKAILPSKLSLANCDVDVVAIDALLSEMEDKSKQSLKSLHIEAKDLNSELISKLLTNFQSMKFLSLVEQAVSSWQLTKSSMAPTCYNSEFTVLQKIETLTLNGFLEDSEAIQMMMCTLRQCESLIELNVTDNKIGKLGTKYMAQSLPYCKSLQKISISNNGMSPHEVLNVLYGMKDLKIEIIADEVTNQGGDGLTVNNGALLKQLEPFKNLQALDLVLRTEHINAFTQSSQGWKDLKELKIAAQPRYMIGPAEAVSRSLKLYLHNVEKLILQYAISNIDGAKSLTAALHQSPNLKVLDLSDNRIALMHLEFLLSVNFSRLEELYLNNNLIHDDETALLSSHFHEYQNLKILSLSYNSFTNSGTKVLAAELHHCTKLIKLAVLKNKIDDDGAYAIADGLQLCSNFRLLYLSRENCECFASKYVQTREQDRKRMFGCNTIEFVYYNV